MYAVVWCYDQIMIILFCPTTQLLTINIKLGEYVLYLGPREYLFQNTNIDNSTLDKAWLRAWSAWKSKRKSCFVALICKDFAGFGTWFIMFILRANFALLYFFQS